MIPNVVKGSDLGGLMRYLVGEGRANEHTNPHVIGGDAHLQAWYGAQVLDKGAARNIADYIDRPRHVFGTEFSANVYRQDPETGAKVVDPERSRDQNVWHCSLSLAAEDGPLSAEKWEAIASDFMDEMGFTAASGKAPARWVAIHHGASKNGNDHVHIAASMVREDGTKWEGRFRDYPTSQKVCRGLELKHDLTPVDGRQRNTAQLGARPVEERKAAAAGLAATDRRILSDRVRAAAVASTSEAEWLRRVRADHVVIRPRFASGTTDVVAGYRVALDKSVTHRDRLEFYGGGQLGKDLSLPRVRENWPAPTIEQADEAAAEWHAAFKGSRRKVDKPRELRKMRPEVAAEKLQAFTEKLQRTPMTDRLAWADAARDLSGALSAWARFDPENAAELREAAAVVARSAQDRRRGGQLGRRVSESPMGTAFLFLSAAADKPTITAGVFINQLMATAAAVRDYQRQLGNLREAQAIDLGVVERLSQLQWRGYQPEGLTTDELQAWRAVHVSRQLTGGDKPAGSPLPNELEPRPQTGARAAQRGRQEHGR